MKRKTQNYASLISGVLILVSSLIGFLNTSKPNKPNWFLALGVGIGIITVSFGINRILINYSIGNDIELKKEHEIAENDERNKFILYKSSYSVYQFMTPVLAIIAISLGFVGAAVWIVFIPVFILILQLALIVIFHNKYNKQY